MDKTYKNILNPALRSSLAMSLLLSVAACGKGCKDGDGDGDGKNKEEKKPLEFTLTAPAEKNDVKFYNQQKTVTTAPLKLVVKSGKDAGKNYKIKIITEAYTTYQYNTAKKDSNAGTKIVLTSPVDGATLNTLFGSEELKKDDNKDIPFVFDSPAGCTSKSVRATVTIVDENNKVVGGPVQVDVTSS